MNSCCNNDSFLFLINLKRRSICDWEVFTPVTSDGSAQSVSTYVVELLRLDHTKVVQQIRIGVWLRISKVNWIVIVLERVSKCESVIASLKIGLLILILLIVVLKVRKILTTTIPPFFNCFVLLRCRARLFDLFRVLLLLFWINKDLHALIVKTFWLDHIEHIEFDFHAFLAVGDSIVEPLGMTFRIDIVLKY